jgi:hypothetical protein
MAFSSNKSWQRRVPEIFSPDPRPGADTFVYCKGCGQPLESRDRFSRSRPTVTAMMCDACREIHGHDLIPKAGFPTFCYRCGGPDEVFVSTGISPSTYHVCSRCLPDRAARYREGDFGPNRPAEVLPDATPATEAVPAAEAN